MPCLTRPLRISLAASLVALAAHSDGFAQPRLHNLEVGQVLTYQSSGETVSDQGRIDSHSTLTVWVVGEGEGGSKRLVIGVRSRMAQVIDGQRSEAPEQSYVTRLDLMPDGRLASSPPGGPSLDLTFLFPPLPSDEDAAKMGWDYEMVPGERVLHCRLAPEPPPEQGRWVIEMQLDGDLERFFDANVRSTADFDAERGLTTRVEAEITQGENGEWRDTEVTVLASAEQREAASMESFAAQANRYFDARDQYGDLIGRARRADSGADQVLAQAESVLREARGALTDELFTAPLDRALAAHPMVAQDAAQVSALRAQFIGRPFPEFTATDFRGQRHSLADLRGKVAVLDFWYAGCGPCIRAMPKIKALVQQFSGRPVVIQGMNTDLDERDAREVIDRMRLNYPSLRAGEIAEGMGIYDFPCLLILDQQGVIRDAHLGLSPDLRGEVTESVESLLADHPG